jgi:hypothetical protein
MKRILGPGAKLKAYEQDNGWEIVLLDGGGRVLGRYLKATDITVDKNGRLVGYGNQLYSLLED